MPGFNIGSGSREEPSNTLSDVTDVHRAHRWRILTLGADGGGSIVPADKLVFARNLQLPGFAVDEESHIGAAIKYKFAKTVNWEDVSVSFYDVYGLFDGILKWQNLVYTTGTGIQPANDYKRRCSFVLTNGEGTPQGPEFNLHGSWPKNISHAALSYESSDAKVVNITLSYDFATFGTITG